MEPNNSSMKNRIKIIDRIITAYKAKKLMLQAQQIQQGNIKEEPELLFDDLKKRMNDAYQKMKRRKKINKLQSIETHWKGLS